MRYGKLLKHISFAFIFPAMVASFLNSLALASAAKGYPVSVAMDGNSLVVRTHYNDTQDLTQRYVGFTKNSLEENNVINFSTYALISKSDDIWATGTVLAGGGDECAPFSINSSYIGANHGHSRGGVTVNAPGHGKTFGDIGSVWLDSEGTRWNLLKVIDENRLLFLSDRTSASITKCYFKTDISGSTLTYSDYGINTADITIESRTTNTMITPAVRTIERTAYSVTDGVRTKITGPAVVFCDYVDIVEKYEIMNPALIADTLRANRPTGGYTEAQDLAIGSPLIEYNMIYRIMDDGTALSIIDHKVLEDVNFDYYGGIQYQVRSDLYEGGVYRYLPKTKPFTYNGINYDFTKGYDISKNAVPSIVLTKEYWEDQNYAPDRQVEYFKNPDGDNVMLLASGYVPILDAAPGVRKYKVNGSVLLYPTKKTYPYLINNTGAGTAGTNIRAVCYKKHVDMSTDNTIGSAYTIPYEDDTYIYLDYHESGTDVFTLSGSMTGKPVNFIDKSENVFYSVSGNKINITVSDSKDYGYLVLRLGEPEPVSEDDGELLKNGGFEKGEENWTHIGNGQICTDTSATHNSSKGCFLMESTNIEGVSELQQTITGLEAGHRYKVTYYLKEDNVVSDTGGMRLQIFGGATGASKFYHPYYKGTSAGWQKIEMCVSWTEATALAEGDSAILRFMLRNAVGSVYIDDVSIVDITSEYLISGSFDTVPASGDTSSYDIMSRGAETSSFLGLSGVTVTGEGENRFARITSKQTVAMQLNLTNGYLPQAFTAGNAVRISFKVRVTIKPGRTGESYSPYIVNSGYMSGIAPITPEYFGDWVDVDIYAKLNTAESMMYFRDNTLDLDTYIVDYDDLSVTVDDSIIIKSNKLFSTVTKNISASGNVYHAYASKPVSYYSDDDVIAPLIHFATGSKENVNYTMFSAIFSTDASGIGRLESMSSTEKGTSAFGLPATKNPAVASVPKEDGRIYSVEVFVWDGVNSGKPHTKKLKYNYN